MNYIDTGFCRSRDFKTGETNRLMDLHDELELEELCVAVFAFSNHSRRQKAAKLLGRVRAVEQLESGIYVVDFMAHTILNKPHEKVSAQYEDGLLHTSAAVPAPSITGLPPIEAGYLLPYEPDIVESELQSMLASAA